MFNPNEKDCWPNRVTDNSAAEAFKNRDRTVQRRMAGGFTDLVDLNVNSTHPNRWRPPQHCDQISPYFSSYRIYKGYGDLVGYEPEPNFMNEGPFTSRITKMAWRGFLIGSLVSHMNVAALNITCPKAKFVRYLYLTPPFIAGPVSFSATRELLATKYGDQTWIYPAASLPPAFIFGVFRNCSVSFTTSWAFLSAITVLIKVNSDSCYLFLPRWAMDHALRDPVDSELNNKDGGGFLRLPWSWRLFKGSTMFREMDPGPEFYNHVPKTELSKYD